MKKEPRYQLRPISKTGMEYMDRLHQSLKGKPIKIDLQKLSASSYTVHLQILGYLNLEDGAPVCCLCKLTHTDPAAFTGIVDYMSRLGWVKRTHSKDDRRIIIISITSKGRKLIETCLV